MKILILCLPGIGDALMATPMLRLLKKNQPKTIIDVAVMVDSVASVFKNNPFINKIIKLSLYRPKNLLIGLKQILALRKKHYDFSILAFPAFRREYHLIQWLVGAQKRIAHFFKKGYWTELNFLDTNRIPVVLNEHNVINNLNLLKVLGYRWEEEVSKDKLYYDLFLDRKDKLFGQEYLEKLKWFDQRVIAFHPGSIDSPAGLLKRWPIGRFAQVADYLIKKRKQKILIFVGPFEKDLGKKLFHLIDDPANCQLVNGITLSQSLGILSQIKLLISNDNGFAHLANALAVKTIALFGPTNPTWCSPYNKKTSINIRKARFTPWFRPDMKVTSPPKFAESGMESIQVEDVIEQIDSLL